MTGRAFAETAVAIVLGLVLSILGAGLLELGDGADAQHAFFVSGPRLILGVLWPALILWALLLLIGNIRNHRRNAGWKVLTNLLSTFVVAVLATVGWLVISVASGRFGMLLFGIGLVASALFFVGAALALLVTHLLIFHHTVNGR